MQFNYNDKDRTFMDDILLEKNPMNKDLYDNMVNYDGTYFMIDKALQHTESYFKDLIELSKNNKINQDYLEKLTDTAYHLNSLIRFISTGFDLLEDINLNCFSINNKIEIDKKVKIPNYKIYECLVTKKHKHPVFNNRKTRKIRNIVTHQGDLLIEYKIEQDGIFYSYSPEYIIGKQISTIEEVLKDVKTDIKRQNEKVIELKQFILDNNIILTNKDAH